MSDTQERDVEGRLAALRRSLGVAVGNAETAHHLGRLPPAHQQALVARVENELRSAERTAAVWGRANRHLLRAETLILLFVEMTEQRRSGPFAEFLCYADLIAARGFAEAVRSALGRGLVPQESEVLVSLPPLCLLDSTYSPVAFPRDSRPLPAGHEALEAACYAVVAAEHDVSEHAGIIDPQAAVKRTAELHASVRRLAAALDSRQDLPFLVIRLPHRLIEQPTLLSILLHEVGHLLDHEFGLAALIAGQLPQQTPGGEPWDRWRGWCAEILADLFGLALGGFGFVHALADFAGPIRLRELDSKYPGVATRVRLLVAAAQELGIDLRFHARLDRVCNECHSEGELPFELNAPEVLARLLDTPIGEGTLRDLLTLPVPAVEWTRLPGDLLLHQLEREFRVEEAVAQFQARVGELLPPEQADLPGWYAFHRERVPSLAPTLVLPGSLRKVPPVALAVAHDEIDFVGATHGQLAKQLALAFELRRKPWRRITLYFLADEQLADIASAAADHASLYDEKRDAIEQLARGFAKGWAARWEFHEFDCPTLFASFWWKGGVLERVHTSGRVWGRNLRDSPGTDFRRVPNGPNRELEELAAGLEWLRRNSRKIEP